MIADVHANLPAFEAVLEDAGTVDEIVFLGDIVGYGPHPAECVDLLRETGARAISGNHDREVLQAGNRAGSADGAVNWLDWTVEQLRSEHLAYIGDLPREMTLSSAGASIRAIHHPPGAPYLHPAMPAAALAKHFGEVEGDAVFFAHSHRPIYRIAGGRRLIGLPAVGQPRDGDPRAGYALENAGRISFRRVAYDVERAVAAVRAIGLDRDFTERWVKFLRTGYDSTWSRPYRPERQG